MLRETPTTTGTQLRVGSGSRLGAPGPGRWSWLRGWLAGSLAVLGLVIAGGLAFISLPTPVEVGQVDGQLVVVSVPVGSIPWMDGAQPGTPARMSSTPGEEAFWIRNSTGGEMEVLLLLPRLPIAQVLGGALFVGLAFVVRRTRLPGAAVLLASGIAFALEPAGEQLGLPAATPLFLLPAAAAALAVQVPGRRAQLAFDGFGFLAVALTIIFVVALMSGLEPVTWNYLWSTPMLIGVSIGAVGELFAVTTRYRLLPTDGDGRLKRMLAATVPLASDSRLEGAEEERARIAIEIHNRLLPQVQSSARSIKDSGSADAADQLDDLAAELRGVMQRNQTVSLEAGGLAEALRADVAAMNRNGVVVSFNARGDESSRPPARVELAAYRIGQAAIDNALRHSGGDHVTVDVNTRHNLLDLTITDDGVGIDETAESEARRRGSIGLAQMRLRAEAVGAKVDVKGRPGAGTTVYFLWMD